MAITGVTDYTNTYAASKTNGSSTTGNAQNYLKELKEKYPGVSFQKMIENYYISHS